MPFEKVYFIPILTFLILNGTVIVTFVMSRITKHVTYLVPYISDSGTTPPESCVFGQMLNLIALLLITVMYIRYRQVRELLSRFNYYDGLKKLNCVTLYSGFAACFGCTLVANFQESNMIIVHWIGANLTFGIGSVYMILQGVISLKIYPVQGNQIRNKVKLFLAIVGFLSFVVFWIGAMISIPKFQGEDMTKWSVEDGYFEIHVCSAVAEWICAGCTAFYIFLLHYDFKGLKISEPIITLDTFSLPAQNRLNNRY